MAFTFVYLNFEFTLIYSCSLALEIILFTKIVYSFILIHSYELVSSEH